MERGGVRRFALGRERTAAHDEEDVAERRRLKSIVETRVRIGRRIGEPAARGDCEVVQRIRREVRERDRVVGPQIRPVRADGEGCEVRPVPDFGRRGLVRRPPHNRARRADAGHVHVVNDRAAGEDHGFRGRQVRRRDILIRRGDRVAIPDLEHAIRCRRPKCGEDRSPPNLSRDASSEGDVLPAGLDSRCNVNDGGCRVRILDGKPDRV